MWRDEHFNHDVAQNGEVGAIEPISCLDALLFSYQHARVSQIEQPTEFLASVLRESAEEHSHIAVVFGAGTGMFPPKEVYGFETVDDYLSAGWSYSCLLHNHTLQRNGERIALGNPALSTSDVQLVRSLATERRLERARVTNGFYTYTATASEFDRLRSRDDLF